MPDARKKILFVDDEKDYLRMLHQLFSMWSAGRWEVFTASNSGQALAILQKESIDLVVVDMRMPVVDGLQFIRVLNRRYPRLPKVALTGFDSEDYRQSCLAEGAELFLVKPGTIEGLETIFTTLDELVGQGSATGFRGVVQQVGLAEIIQIECLGRKSSILEIAAPGLLGRIVIEDGEIVHAETGTLSGMEAFSRLAALDHGDFRLKPFQSPKARTIEGSWEFLLMEAARHDDEASSQTGEPADSIPEPAAQDSASQPPQAATQAQTHSGNSPERPPRPAVRERFLKPGVAEVLVASQGRGVVYQWQSAHPENRLRILRLVHDHARDLPASLPLGAFERLELQGPAGRISISPPADHLLLVRSELAEISPVAGAAT